MRYIIIPLLVSLYLYGWYITYKVVDRGKTLEEEGFKGFLSFIYVGIHFIIFMYLIGRYVLGPIIKFIIHNW